MKEVVLKVDGMFCGGCENRVKNALKTIKGVKDVQADHINKTVKVLLKADVSETILKDKIVDLGYTVIE